MAVAKPVKKTFKRSLNGIIIAMDNKSCCILLQEDKNNNKKKKTINNQPHTQQDQQQKRRCCNHTLSTAARGQQQQRSKKYCRRHRGTTTCHRRHQNSPQGSCRWPPQHATRNLKSAVALSKTARIITPRRSNNSVASVSNITVASLELQRLFLPRFLSWQHPQP